MSATHSLTTTWEDLRKRARQLENEIDSKLVSLNKLGVCLGTNQSRFDVGYLPASSSIEKVPLVQTTLDSLSTELEQSIAKLTEINDQMTEFIHGNNAASLAANPAFMHTMRRHRDILRDYSNEFQRTRGNIKTRLDREELMGGGSDSELNKSGGLNRRSDAYLKEHEHAKSSHRMIDDQIQIAMATKENLNTQHSGLRDITRKITTITTERYPAINSLMHKIQFKKRKDTVVLAAVISFCLILMFLYMSS